MRGKMVRDVIAVGLHLATLCGTRAPVTAISARMPTQSLFLRGGGETLLGDGYTGLADEELMDEPRSAMELW